MKQSHLLFVLVALVAVGLGAAGAETTPAAPEKVAATVNGEKIPEATFMGMLMARYGDRCLAALIDNLAIRQAAKAAGVTVTGEELMVRYVTAERSVETQAPLTGENFLVWLAKRSLTPDYFRTELYHQMLLEKMVAGQVKVTNEDVSGYYQANKDALAEPAMVRVAHICAETAKQAQVILADLRANKITWEAAAKQYSLDPWTKENGGDLGFLQAADSPLVKAAFALRANGEISEPVESPMGFHLVKRLAFREARVPKYEEVEESIREQLRHSRLSRLASAKRQEVTSGAKSEILLKMPGEPLPPGVTLPAPPATPATPTPAPKPPQ